MTTTKTVEDTVGQISARTRQKRRGNIEPRVLCKADAAAYLGVSVNGLEVLIKRGHVRILQFEGIRKICFDRWALDDLKKKSPHVLQSRPACVTRPKTYPDPPKPKVPATGTGDGLPDVSGVYFVWSGDALVYVGQTRSINRRVRVSAHRAVLRGDWISWLGVPVSELLWVEAFYIGTYRPTKNFGHSGVDACAS